MHVERKEERSDAVSEADPRFSSGPWTGYWVQGAPGGLTLGWMDLQLRFSNGVLTGTGRDLVGDFSLKGRYDLASGTCFIRKRYPSHEAFYSGSSDGTGIWGRWEIFPNLTGTFSIWPGSAGDGLEESARAGIPFGAELVYPTPLDP